MSVFTDRYIRGEMKLVHITDSQGTPYLQTTTCFKVEKEIWYLSLGYDLSEIYQIREQQQKTYGWIFLGLVLLCSVFSYILSKLLTRSVQRLSQAAREIASGNLGCRSDISTDDEFGELSKDFDRMAEQVEQSVLKLQESVKRQQMFMETVSPKELVQMLLLNILDNARKALESGGTIRICSYILPDGCRFVITDNGKGIPQESLKHLTEAFYRVDKSRARAQGGVGLGLALCSKIVKMHNGSIRFKSKVGQGTKVMIELRGGCVCSE